MRHKSYTDAELAALPHALDPAQCMRLLNCDRHTLALLRDAHPSIVAYHTRAKQSRYKYVKLEIFKLARIHSNHHHATIIPLHS